MEDKIRKRLQTLLESTEKRVRPVADVQQRVTRTLFGTRWLMDGVRNE